MNVMGQPPREARVVQRVQESPEIFTVRLRFSDPSHGLTFSPGQFNMLYLYGVGEVPISIVSDPLDSDLFEHTIRVVGRVTRGLAQVRAGDRLGVRGPFGVGWPLTQAQGKHLVIITGGLGCAPVVAAINYLFRRREQFGQITLLQGVKHHADLIWRQRYQDWAAQADTQVALAADNPGPHRDLFAGNVVQLLDQVSLRRGPTLAMVCGPEVMMHAAVQALLQRGMSPTAIWLSLERNMQCADGLCGHCQLGPLWVCKDGPVFRYDQVADWFMRRGF